QLATRAFFAEDGRPARFAVVAPGPEPEWPCREASPVPGAGGPLAGTRILQFGSGAAGPIATRFFAEHGATVVRVESRTRPDFLRTYALSPDNPHGLEGSDMFDALNVNKLGVTLNMNHPRGPELAKRVAFESAEAVSENFAPKDLRGFGIDSAYCVAVRSVLVMVCC